MRTLFTILFVALTASNSIFASDLNTSIGLLEGSWGWGKCEDHKHKIRALPNKEFLEFEYESGGYGYYYVAGMTKKGLKLVLLSEDRTDDQGNIVTWYVVFDGPNTYQWLRSDRQKNDLRGPITRCK